MIGICTSILTATQPNYHQHTYGYIQYCTTCWWKRITTNSTKILYASPDPCACIGQAPKKCHTIKICEKTQTAVYFCNSCSLRMRRHVDHLYVYLGIAEQDYDQFYLCPVQESAMSFPIKHKYLHCPSCNSANMNVDSHGCQWLCYSCQSEHLILPILNESIYSNNKKDVYISSGVSWQCKKCSKLQMFHFNDSLHHNQKIICSFCN